MADSLQVGLHTCARWDDLNYPVAAQFRNYADHSIPGAALSFAVNLPATTTLNLFSQPFSNILTLTVTATNTGTIFPSNEIQFVWQRANGLGGFTNIPFASAQVASTPFTNSAVGSSTTSPLTLADQGAQFRVIAKGPGSLAVTSAVTTLNVNYADANAPVVVNSSITLGSATLALVLSGPLDLTTVSNAANYVITNSAGQAITVTGVTLQQFGLNGTNVSRIVLQLGSAITNGTQYFVRVNNLKGTNGVIIAANSLVAASPPNTIKVDIFNNLTGTAGEVITNMTFATKYLSNQADYVYWTNVFNFNHNGSAFGDRLNNYGGRISAYFIPPTNGQYKFYVRGDDPHQLWMNTNAANSTDPNAKTLLCYQLTANANYAATVTNQVSTNVTLTAGQAYYFELLFKENSGGDGGTMTFRSFADAAIPPANENADGRFFQPIVANPYYSNSLANLAPIRVDVFTNITGGTAVSLLTSSAKYINNTPDWTVYMPGFGYAADLLASGGFPSTIDNYGVKLTALLVAPTNGFYRFFLKGDDECQILMNTNGIDPAGKVSVAYLPSARPYYTNVTAVQSVNGVTNTGVSMPIQLTNGQHYYLEVLMKENTGGDGVGMVVRSYIDLAAATNSVTVPPTNEVAQATLFRTFTNSFGSAIPYSPAVQVEVYPNSGGAASGTAIADLFANARFQAGIPENILPVPLFGLNKDGITSQFPGDNYGARISGYFVAPSNSIYRFFVKADDAAVLYMNTNGVDYAGKVQVAVLGGARNSYAADGSMSTAITLTNGQRYYMELLFKEGGGGDYGVVAVIPTGTSATAPTAPGVNTVTPAEFFAPTIGPVTANNIVQSPSGTTFNEGQAVTLSVNGIIGANPIGIQWRKNGVAIPNAFSNSVTIFLTPADVGINTYSVSVYNSQNLVERFLNLNVAAFNLDVTAPSITSAFGNGLLNEVTVVFSENVLPSTATNIANYSIPGLVISGALMRSANSVGLVTSPQTPGTRYTVIVNNVKDLSRSANQIVPNSSYTFTAWAMSRGFVTVDYFTGVNGSITIPSIFSEPKFLFNTPDATEYKQWFGAGSFIPGGANFADNYIGRVYGWFIAPSNGLYRFYIRSDDTSILYMNTNSVNSADPAGKVPIAEVILNSVAFGVFSSGPNTSVNIPLTGGQLYYMEALYKEGTGGDGFQMTFREAGDPSTPPTTEAAPGFFFANLGNPDLTASLTLTNQPVSVTVGMGQVAGLTVGAVAIPAQTITYQWQQFDFGGGLFRDLLTATNSAVFVNYATPGTYMIRALASVPGITRTSAVASVTVTNVPETSPTPPALAWASSSTNGLTVTAQFNEAVTSGSAQTPGNYTLAGTPSGTYTVSSAVLRADGKTVVLTITPALTPGNATNYTLTASGIVDVDDGLAGGGAYTFYAPSGNLRYDIYYNLPNATPVPSPFPSHTPEFTGILPNIPGAFQQQLLFRIAVDRLDQRPQLHGAIRGARLWLSHRAFEWLLPILHGQR
jgi:hypothetical protein